MMYSAILALALVVCSTSALKPVPRSSARSTALKLRGGSVLGDVWTGYNDKLASDPILTKAATSLVGFSIGDVLAQTCVQKESDFDVKRLLQMAAFGFMIHGTTGHYFYGFLDGVIPGKGPLDVASKVAIDQILWAPIFGIMFFTFLGATAGQGPSEIMAKIKADLVAAVTGSWTVWPIAHAINFAFIPSEQRLLYINSIQIFYNIFLSILGSR
jgi:protein Mpv17